MQLQCIWKVFLEVFSTLNHQWNSSQETGSCQQEVVQTTSAPQANPLPFPGTFRNTELFVFAKGGAAVLCISTQCLLQKALIQYPRWELQEKEEERGQAAGSDSQAIPLHNITKPPRRTSTGHFKNSFCSLKQSSTKVQAAHSMPQPRRTTAPAGNPLCLLFTDRSWGKPVLLNSHSCKLKEDRAAKGFSWGHQTTNQSGTLWVR